MPIKEESFRIGCGRYLQGAGYISKIGNEILRLGKKPLILGGKTALEITKYKLEKALADTVNDYKIITYTGTCNDEYAKEISELTKEGSYDVIIGVGGGVICDLAKLCGYFSALPVITVPTSCATCAAYTPLSVRYTVDGRTVGTMHYEYEVDCVIADTEIIAAQPTRLLLAGVFDALAKFVEIKHRFNEETLSYPMGLDYAYVMSRYSYMLLNEKIRKCIADCGEGQISSDVENVIFTTIAATGVISGIARGSNQTALAHKFYEATRYLFPETARPYLHGEIVGIGLILQNHFNGESENNDALIALMKNHGMPYRLSDIGVSKNDEIFNAYYDKLSNSSAIENEDDKAKLAVSLRYLFEVV